MQRGRIVVGVLVYVGLVIISLFLTALAYIEDAYSYIFPATLVEVDARARRVISLKLQVDEDVLTCGYGPNDDWSTFLPNLFKVRYWDASCYTRQGDKIILGFTVMGERYVASEIFTEELPLDYPIHPVLQPWIEFPAKRNNTD